MIKINLCAIDGKAAKKSYRARIAMFLISSLLRLSAVWSLILACVSMVTKLSRPFLPVTKPFCEESALMAIVGDISQLTTAATVLLIACPMF